MFKRLLTLTLALMLMVTPLLTAIPASADESYITVNFHYYRHDGDYSNWNLWAWDYYGQTLIYGNDEYGNLIDMPGYSFIVEDGIAVSTLHVSTYVDYMGYIVRYGEWESKDVDYDQFIDLSGVNGNVVDIYITSGVPTSSYYEFPTTEELIDNGFMVVDGDGTEWEPPVLVPGEPDGTLEPNRIYAYVPANWSDVRLWAWDDAANSVQGDTPWPGNLVMSYVGDGAYYIEIPAGYPNMLITNGGAEQSVDISTNLKEDDEVYIDITDPSNPNVYYSMGELVDNCPHNVHDQDGMCQVCGTIVEHFYSNNGYCSCGNYREFVASVGPGDSGIIMDPNIDEDMLVDPESSNSTFVGEESRIVPSFLILIVLAVVGLVLLLLALAIPVVLVVVIVIVIVSIVKKKKK